MSTTNQQRQPAARFYFRNTRPSVAYESTCGVDFRNIDDIDEMVRHVIPNLNRRFRRADIHPTVDERGVHAHNFERQLLRQF